MPRGPRLDAPGTLHHVIIRGIERRRIVDDDTDRQDLVSSMGVLAAETDTKIYAWALMTNHAHILLRSSYFGLSRYMRRMLTGYAIRYNRRHKRFGHLFQNRYKSIVCQEGAYFKQLVRYIHLNPLRAGLVDRLSQLDRYPWCGHSIILGKVKREWQDSAYALNWFGKRKRAARQAYREFVRKGISQGKRPDLVGGELIRSMGGWSQVLSMRRVGEYEDYDHRILGSGEFVKTIVGEADERLKRMLPLDERLKQARAYIDKICKTEGLELVELKSGSRRQPISRARAQIAVKLVKEIGLTMAETARQLGVTTSAVARILERTGIAAISNSEHLKIQKKKGW